MEKSILTLMVTLVSIKASTPVGAKPKLYENVAIGEMSPLIKRKVKQGL